MFKVGDYVTPDLEVISHRGVLKDQIIIMPYIGNVYRIRRIGSDWFDLEDEPNVGWLFRYWKLAVTPEVTFKLIKKYAE